MVRAAIVLAFLALIISVSALFLPVTITEELSWRAGIGASISTSIAIILGAIALLLTARIESADYRAEQEIKSDLAKLHAALSSSQIRAGIKLDKKARAETDLSLEKSVVHAFLNSVTGFAFYMLAAKKSETSAKSPEEWRVFHLYAAELIETHDVSVFLNRANRMQRILAELKTEDLDSLRSFARDLSGSTSKFSWAIENNVILKAMSEIYGGGTQSDPEGGVGAAIPKLAYLKRIGVEDPDIDLFLAVSDGDTKALQSAIDRGANVNVTDSEVLRRHAEKLKDFKN